MNWWLYGALVSALLALQFVGRTRLGAWAAWLPQFLFFGPKPLAFDPVCYFRGLREGDAGAWHELQIVSATRLSALWHPERRIGKAAVDLYRQLLRIDPELQNQDYELLLDDVCSLLTRDPLLEGYSGMEVVFGYGLPDKNDSLGHVQELLSVVVTRQ